MAENQDTATKAQGRVIVSLPADVAAALTKLGETLSAAVKDATDMDVQFTPAQVVQSLIKTASEAQDAKVAAGAKGGK